jgi:hypothetical protein
MAKKPARPSAKARKRAKTNTGPKERIPRSKPEAQSKPADPTVGEQAQPQENGAADQTAQKPRASLYAPEIAEKILERLAAGEGLHEICRDEGMPAESTVRKWAIEDELGFGAQYVRARDIGVDCRADRLKALAASAIGLDGPGVQAMRLVVDTEKWYLSKIAPKRYGDRLDLVVDDKRPDTPEARKARIAELIALGVPDDAPAAGV